ELDVTSERHWEIVTEQIERGQGGLHILVNSAGISGPGDVSNPETTRLEDWRRVFEVNVEGTWLGCRAAIRTMRRTSAVGSIINISSVAAFQPSSNAFAYGASKATVRHMTKSIAQYCALEGLKIRCNSVHPGPVKTALLEKFAQERAQSRGV